MKVKKLQQSSELKLEINATSFRQDHTGYKVTQKLIHYCHSDEGGIC